MRVLQIALLAALERSTFGLSQNYSHMNSIYIDPPQPLENMVKIEPGCFSRKGCFIYTVLLFILAGIFEIGGGYLLWIWLREGKELIFAFLGVFILFFIWNSAHFPAFLLPQDICNLWRDFCRYVSFMGLDIR
jgi:small multidrug resistance family-3 protein